MALIPRSGLQAYWSAPRCDSHVELAPVAHVDPHACCLSAHGEVRPHPVAENVFCSFALTLFLQGYGGDDDSSLQPGTALKGGCGMNHGGDRPLHVTGTASVDGIPGASEPGAIHNEGREGIFHLAHRRDQCDR